MPSTRSFALGGGVIAIAAFSGLAAAQPATSGSGLGLGSRIGIRFVVGFVVNLVLAGALVGLGPRYATETVTELRKDPIGSFGWGLLVGIGVPIALALLALTVVGLLVAIPGLLVLAVVGLVGHAVAIVWVGTVLRRDDAVGGEAALVGAFGLAIPASIPILGNLFTSFVGFFGIGVVGRSLYAVWRD